jgi:hypothetical protein
MYFGGAMRAKGLVPVLTGVAAYILSTCAVQSAESLGIGAGGRAASEAGLFVRMIDRMADLERRREELLSSRLADPERDTVRDLLKDIAEARAACTRMEKKERGSCPDELNSRLRDIEYELWGASGYSGLRGLDARADGASSGELIRLFKTVVWSEWGGEKVYLAIKKYASEEGEDRDPGVSPYGGEGLTELGWERAAARARDYARDPDRYYLEARRRVVHFGCSLPPCGGKFVKLVPAPRARPSTITGLGAPTTPKAPAPVVTAPHVPKAPTPVITPPHVPKGAPPVVAAPAPKVPPSTITTPAPKVPTPAVAAPPSTPRTHTPTVGTVHTPSTITGPAPGGIRVDVVPTPSTGAGDLSEVRKDVLRLNKSD